MKRAIFVLLFVVAAVLLSPLWKHGADDLEDTVSNATVHWLGGTYRAIMAHHGDTLERVVLIEGGQDPTIVLTRDGEGRYDLGYAGPTGPVHVSLDADVAVLDRRNGVQRVSCSATLEELGRKIREREPLDPFLSR